VKQLRAAGAEKVLRETASGAQTNRAYSRTVGSSVPLCRASAFHIAAYAKRRNRNP
jgi:hypothetical protein